MKKLVVVTMLMLSLTAIGCQNEKETSTKSKVENEEENKNIKEEETKEEETKEEVNFSFGEDLVFTEENGIYEIDLDNSSSVVKQKHEALSKVITDKEILSDVVAVTTTTANILNQIGIMPVGAPESPSLSKELIDLQYKVEGDSKIDKTKVLNIGSAISPNIEAIVELDPKLVLFSDAMPPTDFMDSLKNAGLNTSVLGQSDYLDMFVLLDVIGKVTEHSNEKTNEQMKTMVEILKETKEIISTKKQEQKTVAILQVLEGSVKVNNKDTVLGKIVAAIGMENVYESEENAELNKEKLIEMNPDYIIYYGHGPSADAVKSFQDDLNSQNSTFRSLKALEEEKIFQVASDEFVFGSSVDLDIIKVITFLAGKFYE